MAVETATERAIFFSADDFGTTATYTPSGGSPTSVKGIFDKDYIAVDSGGSVPIALEQPRFLCATSDVSAAAEDDAITIQGTAYLIKVVENDGTGVTILVLEEV